VLSEVQGLLIELEEEIALVKEIPAVKEQLEEILAAVRN
jgi:hypothetical protein